MLSAALAASPGSGAETEIRGIWVECQGSNNTLETKAKISEMINRASLSNLNAVFLQVHRGNSAWFRSSFADPGPCKAFRAKYGCDPLSFAIDQAHARGIELHAWVNVYRILRNTKAPILKSLGSGAVTCDGKGKSLLKYPARELPDNGYWLDPGDSRVNGYLQNLIAELVKRYPALDGVHLDFVRYPPSPSKMGSLLAKGRDFGYSPRAVEAFRGVYGFSPLEMKKTGRNCGLWDDWRRDRVTSFVRETAERVKGISPKVQVSAAVFADVGKAYSAYFQDWRRWMAEGILDFVAPMNYTVNSKLMKSRTKSAVSSAGKGRVYIGLGAYKLTNKPDVLLAQIRDAMNQGADGVVFFSYDAMMKRQSIFPLLRQRVFSRACSVPVTARKK